MKPLHGELLAIAPTVVERLDSIIDGILEQMKEAGPEIHAVSGGGADPLGGMFRPYEVREGVLTIRVDGFLMDAPFALPGMMTGYGYLRDALSAAAEDENVRRVALVVDSFGGIAQGMFEAAEAVRAFDAKPLTAFVQHNALSAAYALVSGADEIITTKMGLVGSVGAIVERMSVRRALEQHGIDVAVIASGERKAEGHPNLDMTESERERLRARVEKAHDDFAEFVASARGLDKKAVLQQESAVYTGEEAVAAGLADRVADVAAEYRNYHEPEKETMTKNTEVPAAETAGNTDIKAQLDAARAEGVKAERERIAAIMALESAKGREEFALKLALTTDMGVEEASGLLEAVPAKEEKESEPVAAKTPFEAAMAAHSGEPVPAADSGDTGTDGTPDLLASFKRAAAV